MTYPPRIVADTLGSADERETIVHEMLGVLRKNSPSLTFVFDQPTRKFIHLEGAVEELLGVTRDEIMDAPDFGTLLPKSGEHGHPAQFLHDLAVDGQSSACSSTQCWNGRKIFFYGAREVRIYSGRSIVAGSMTKIDLPPKTTLPDCDILRVLATRAPEGCAATDRNGRFRFINERHLAMFGYHTHADLMGESWKKLYEEDVALYIERNILPVVAKQGTWQGKLLAKRRDGTNFHQGLTLSQSEDGGLLCHCDDITDQVELEERLRQKKVMFKEFLNLLPVGVMIRSTTGRYEFINSAAHSFLQLEGIESEQQLRDPSDAGRCLIADGRFASWAIADQKILQTRTGVRFDFPLSWGGKDWVLEVEKRPMKDHGDLVTHISTVVADVTDKRKLERESEQVAENNREYLEMQREFVSMISHEFRTPLSSIQGVHFLLNQQNERVPTANQDNFRRLLVMQRRALENISSLVSQVLLLNRVDQMSTDANSEPINLHEEIVKIIAVMNGSQPAPRVELNFKLPLNYEVRIDQLKFRALAENLISNALKYSPPTAAVQVGVAGEECVWSLTVTDHGRGIPAADRPNLFKPFSRARNVENTPGTGLGLTIVDRIVKIYGGTLTMKSALGKGTVFSITFPLDPHPRPAVPGILIPGKTLSS